MLKLVKQRANSTISCNLIDNVRFILIASFIFLYGISIAVSQNFKGYKASENASLGGCISAEDLVLSSIDLSTPITPCDLIGAHFLSGYSIQHTPASTGYADTLEDESLLYYVLARSYLRGRIKADAVMDYKNHSLLMLASAAIMSRTFSSAISDQYLKIRIYRAFEIFEYWRNHPSLFESEFAGYSFEDFFTNEIAFLLDEIGIRDPQELQCYILFDLPGLSVEEILITDKFKICVKIGGR